MGEDQKSGAESVKQGAELVGAAAALAAVAPAVTPLTVLGAGAALVGALTGAVAPALAKRREERGKEYIARVAHHLANLDPVAAAYLASGHAEQPEFLDAVERGYEQIRRAFDPLARECICMLVAQHTLAADPTSQRGDFVAVGLLLERCDQSLLEVLEVIASLYIAVSAKDGERVVAFITRAPTGMFLAVDPGARSKRFTERKVLRQHELRSALSSLEGSGIGVAHAGRKETPPDDARSDDASSDYVFGPRDRSRMLLLARCLEPVRLQRGQPKTDGGR